MTSRTFDWLSGQIDQHAEIHTATWGYDHRPLTRLADAAAALKNRHEGAQAFGMVLPTGGVEGSDVLVARCLDVIAKRAELLAPETRDALGRLLRTLRLDPLIAAPLRPTLTHTLRVSLLVVVEDPHTQNPIIDAQVLRRLDGWKARGPSLTHLPCIHDAVEKPDYVFWEDTSWLADGFAQLTFRPEAGDLECELVFSLVREPSAQEREMLLSAIRGELFETSWMRNLDWHRTGESADVVVHVQQCGITHQIVALSGR